MKNIYIVIICLLLSTTATAQEVRNYIAIVNGDSIKINLNTSFQYKSTKGELIDFKIVQPDILTYSDDFISFKHSKENNVSNTVLEEDIEQLMVMKSTGSGFIVQKYYGIDPSLLTMMLLNEVTKESISYGYAKSQEAFSVDLQSGQTLNGSRMTLTYKGEEEIYTAAAFSGKDEGIIILTMVLNDDYSAKDHEMIDLFWETLEIKRK
ncbi:MAG: hypothetical protein HKN54_09160 [Flavobacteriaceae bacterium]|nr:hypothetical protein [Flavobacteriaceae bacterium]